MTFAGALFVCRKLLAILVPAPDRPLKFRRQVLFSAALTLLYVFAYNGGLSLTQNRLSRPRAVVFASISDNPVVNASLSNPMTLITWMYKEYRETGKISPVDSDPAEFAKILKFFGIPVTQGDPLQALTAVTAKNAYLAAHRPNVVIAYEESFSTHLQRLSDPAHNFDLLGALQQSLDKDFHFASLISEDNSTHPSVIRFAFRIPNDLVTNTRYAKIPYRSFFLKPYKEKGYATVFITASDCHWGNLDTIFRASGFDELICSDTIRKKYPQARILTWGHEDQVLFDVAHERLSEAVRTGVPAAIFLLTSLNHPPYDLPETAATAEYTGLNFKDHYDPEAFSNYTFDLFVRQIQAFRYAANALGSFIQRVRNDPQLQDNTVVAYTGDHNTRISYQQPAAQDAWQALLTKGVLSGIYLPEALRQHLPHLSYQKDIIASHKDLMPTLYENTLSEARYLALVPRNI